ncbi:MAG: putative CtpA-like serine protease [candidate division BRC1 bacterium ADurb.BinA364]|nr:MAG: putative CtpA-like serine protease [candidate division BRC1 bacterium ADurb.BinA364]
MLILINRGSASASEIFAGAMRDHGRARLVGPKGERTFGKGSVQTIDPLEHSLERDERGNLLPAALRLTTARYYTPNGTAIDNKDPEKRGLAPDLEVELTREHQFELTRRGMLLGEVNLVEPGKAKNGDAGNENGAEPKEDAEKEEPFVDLQLQFAIDEMKRMLDSGANATADVAKAAPAETEPLPVAAAN